MTRHILSRTAFFTSLWISLMLWLIPVQAQTAYPVKTVRIMVGAGPGGGTDIIARMLAEKFAESLKGTWVVENKPGASNTIAADFTAKAAADGHTLLVATNTGQAIAPHLMKLSFDPIKDLIPIGLIVTVPNVLVVGAQVPVNNVADLVKAMKAKPGDFKYGSSGVGSTQHIAGEAFDLAAGTKSEHISYKGSSQAHLDIIGGSIQMMFDTTSSAMAQIKSGKFKPLAVTTSMRSPQLPDVPTLTEAGVRGADMSTWYGLFVTAGTPAEVVGKLQQELARILKLPEVDARLKGLGGEPGAITPMQFGELNRSEYERFGKLIRDTGIKLQ
ncbi:MAG: tripartite tricarboxylate transporter substrate binding protein [Betaproteobacteria bacterium]|nr:tripartite tricarboxylate transporter substrate binding protein [Betaproteobacteria bacterium]NBY05129.1 tripartite tricarboxylate transporter substrate binding protein [Betaproteobacteria bacterium]